MNEQPENIKHRISSGWVCYSANGITFKPHILWKPLVIPWREIEFISPTPAVKLIQSNWRTSYHDRDLMPDDALQKLRLFTLHIVIKDYKKLKYNRFLNSALGLNRLLDANDKPDEKRASINYHLKKNSLNVPLRSLLDFLDKNSRFDLLILGDSFFP